MKYNKTFKLKPGMSGDEFKQTDAYKQTYEYKLKELGDALDKLIEEIIKAIRGIIPWKK